MTGAAALVPLAVVGRPILPQLLPWRGLPNQITGTHDAHSRELRRRILARQRLKKSGFCCVIILHHLSTPGMIRRRRHTNMPNATFHPAIVKEVARAAPLMPRGGINITFINAL